MSYEPFISTEEALFHRVQHVTQFCFYRRLVWTNQTLALLCIFFKFSI